MGLSDKKIGTAKNITALGFQCNASCEAIFCDIVQSASAGGFDIKILIHHGSQVLYGRRSIIAGSYIQGSLFLVCNIVIYLI